MLGKKCGNIDFWRIPWAPYSVKRTRYGVQSIYGVRVYESGIRAVQYTVQAPFSDSNGRSPRFSAHANAQEIMLPLRHHESFPSCLQTDPLTAGDFGNHGATLKYTCCHPPGPYVLILTRDTPTQDMR